MMNIRKLLKRSVILFCVLFLYCNLTRDSEPLEPKTMDRFLPDLRYLLLWTPIHGIDLEGQQHFINKGCKKINCYFTSNRTMLDATEYFDAVIFNLQDVSKGVQMLPVRRGHYQKYIFAANDSADNYPVCNPVYDSFFNWTWTYRALVFSQNPVEWQTGYQIQRTQDMARSDSTVPYRFITAYNEDHEEIGDHFSKILKYKSDVVKKVTNKSVAAATFLDKCTSRSKREEFVAELTMEMAPYNMTLDVFGKCGQKECRKKTMKPCFWKLKKLYFFYLALEDSLDEDYVTQDVLYAYDNNAIPVVYGQADYERYLPPNSYIDALELGVKALAKVMYEVVTNHTRYKEFFKWKNEYTIKKSDVLDVCQLCTALNNPHWLTYDITYTDFREWWNPNYTDRCS